MGKIKDEVRSKSGHDLGEEREDGECTTDDEVRNYRCMSMEENEEIWGWETSAPDPWNKRERWRETRQERRPYDSGDLCYGIMSSRKKKYLNMSKDEARDILEEEARGKDFWAVDDYNDNFDRLQGVIDVLFNSLEGNKYKVAYQENQNGTRLQIQCQICGKDLTSYDPFITHENGKNHKKVRQQNLTPQDPNLSRKLEQRKHNEQRYIFPPDTLEDKIDCTENLVLGIQFVYKEVIKGNETFSCQLCKVHRVEIPRMYNHLTDNRHTAHNAKYLEVKYGFMKKSRAETEQYGKGVEEREGKIHSNVVDFTKQLSPQLILEPVRRRSVARSVSPASRSRRSRHQSSRRDSSSPMSISSDGSRSPSPWERRPIPSAVPPPPSLPPLSPPPPPPLMTSVGVTADLSENPRHILKEVDLLQEVQCREIIQEDEDMQKLLIMTLGVLNKKMLRYYERSGAVYSNANIQHKLSESAKKVRNYVMVLDSLKEGNDSKA